MKMIAVFEVEFESDLMFGEESIRDEYDGDMFKAMKWLITEEGGPFGIMDGEFKLVQIKETP